MDLSQSLALSVAADRFGCTGGGTPFLVNLCHIVFICADTGTPVDLSTYSGCCVIRLFGGAFCTLYDRYLCTAFWHVCAISVVYRHVCRDVCVRLLSGSKMQQTDGADLFCRGSGFFFDLLPLDRYKKRLQRLYLPECTDHDAVCCHVIFTGKKESSRKKAPCAAYAPT